MHQAKQELDAALKLALAELSPVAAAAAAFEFPRDSSHGDLSCSAVLELAASLGQSPRHLAPIVMASLLDDPATRRWVESVEIAGPGFLNLHLKAQARHQVVRDVLTAGDRFGCMPPTGRRILVEFVSANPTGPLHVGHARQAALGDAICNLYASQGWGVHREFFYNDAGVQIEMLARSVQLRARGLGPGHAGWVAGAYNGEYIADIAAAFVAGTTVKAGDRDITASGDIEDLDAVRRFAVAYMRREQDLDLQAFGIRFDSFFLESALHASGMVDDVVRRMVEAGKTYELDSALWLRTSQYGDDKDRVVRKSDGTYTYFVPDVAYHISKAERGFAKAVNIQGMDHHGTIARVRAGLQAVGTGLPSGFPDYVLHTMVRVTHGGREIKVSKRAGNYVTLRDLIAWTGRDAVRFLLLSRKPDTEYVFDVASALRQDSENPVYYVQYAHARICSILAKWGGPEDQLSGVELSPLQGKAAKVLMAHIARYSAVLAAATAEFAPHQVTFYLRQLAAASNSYYDSERALVDDEVVRLARLSLLAASAQVLRNGLAVLGVEAPRNMASQKPAPV